LMRAYSSCRLIGRHRFPNVLAWKACGYMT